MYFMDTELLDFLENEITTALELCSVTDLHGIKKETDLFDDFIDFIHENTDDEEMLDLLYAHILERAQREIEYKEMEEERGFTIYNIIG